VRARISKPMNDIEKLEAAAEKVKFTHIWEVLFEVQAAGVEEEAGWIFDELNVAAGSDGAKAIEKVKEYVSDVEKYEVIISDFRIVGLRILAEADIQ
jgi:hypothetical protein